MLAPFSSLQMERVPTSHLIKQLAKDSLIIIKKTKLFSEFDARFCNNEASNLSQCIHPCIVKLIRSYVGQDNVFYIEMEYVEGGDLSKTKVNGSFERVWRWIYQIAHALNYIHKMGIIHRDVKLENIVLDKQANAKLIDFGASISKRNLEKEGFRMAGTPCYTAPEMIRRQKYDEKVDVYALGVCVYQLVFQKTPFQGQERRDYWRNSLYEDVHYDQNCPDELATVMRRMLEKDATKRATTFEIMNCQPILLRLNKKN